MANCSAFCAFLLFACVTQALCSPAFSTIHQLLSRQLPTSLDPTTLPAQCRPMGCDSIVATYNRCAQSSTATCLCSKQSEADFGSCINCLLSVYPEQQLTDQNYFDQYVNGCRAAGVALQPSTVQPANSKSTTTSGSLSSLPSVSLVGIFLAYVIGALGRVLDY